MRIYKRIQNIFLLWYYIFVHLGIIPEFWKSQTYQSMEIEFVSYYSLLQIYSARMLLFGIVDIVLISVFCWLTFFTLNVTLLQILIQFILPMTVTAGICFGMLDSKRPLNEAVAIIMCIGWSSVWSFIVLYERIYAEITYPVWSIFLEEACPPRTASLWIPCALLHAHQMGSAIHNRRILCSLWRVRIDFHSEP